jgi:hypothetical protein
VYLLLGESALLLLQFTEEFLHGSQPIANLEADVCVGGGISFLLSDILAFLDEVAFGEELLLEIVEFGSSEGAFCVEWGLLDSDPPSWLFHSMSWFTMNLISTWLLLIVRI